MDFCRAFEGFSIKLINLFLITQDYAAESGPAIQKWFVKIFIQGKFPKVSDR
jgi:hypothetical protein